MYDRKSEARNLPSIPAVRDPGPTVESDDSLT